MNIHVLLAKHTANPDGLPSEWPVETKEVDGAPVSPWISMSPEEYSVHVETHQAAKELWNAERLAALVTVPQSVSPRQIRRALNNAGLLAMVEVAVAAADKATQIDWEFGLEVRRDWPVLNSMAVSLGMTSDQVDQLFIAANQF